MNYLITGGAGFIGSHLAEHLVEHGHHVHVYDNLSTGRLANIEHLIGHERFGYTVGDVLDQKTLAPVVAQCDQVFHLAAAVGVKLIMERPVETISTNVRGTENVLELAHRHCKKVLIASTSEVYGKSMETNGRTVGLNEDDDSTLGSTTKRRWAYACSKAIDEFLALAFHEEMGLPVVIIRFFNTVGPRQVGRYGMVIPNLVQQALRGDPVRVFGDGEQTRCFTYVADTVRATVSLMQATAAEGQVFNVGSCQEVSMNTLAERILALTGSSSEIVHIPYEQVYGPGYEDMRRRTPDISKLWRLTGFRPAYTLDDILREVIDYFRRGVKRPSALTRARVLDH